MNKWSVFDGGRYIGSASADGDVILYDEQHRDGARITLKRSREYVSVSLNIYGWMDHTRFFNTDVDAQREYRAMRSAIDALLRIIYTPEVNKIRVWEAISDFVRRFP
jgi:hypothetical protein